MALYLDRIGGDSYVVTVNGIVHRRMAVVTGVSTVNPALVAYLATQAPNMPQMGDPHPAHPSCTVTELEAVGINDADDSIEVMITYETPRVEGGVSIGGGPGFVFEDDMGLTGESTQLLPGPSKVPIVPKIKDANGKIREYQGTLDVQRPLRTVTLSGLLKKGVSPDKYREHVGKVNQDQWNGKPPGYWLFSGMRSSTTDGGKSYSLSIQIVTKNNEDWSQYVVLRDRNTDQLVTVDDKVVAQLKQFDYKYGILYPGGQNDKGILRAGPYEMTPFNSIFGAG